MASKVWDKSDDGSIEYVSLNKENLEAALQVMRNAFFIDENVCKAVELYKSPNGIKELEDLSMNAAKDGVSVIALDKSTGQVVGIAFNKLQELNSEQGTYFEEYIARCKEDSSKALIQFMIEADGACNLFEVLKVDCILEIMFLAVDPQFRKKGIGKKLCEISIKLAKSLNNGENVKISITDSPAQLEPIPKAVSAIFTSVITQKFGKDLGFTMSKEISYDRWEFKGKKFSSRIGPETPSTTIEYKLL